MINDAATEAEASTIGAILRYHRHKNPPKYSKYLSMKNLGKKCLREAWFDFRWAALSDVPGRVVKLMETGLREEPVLLQDFKSIGYEVKDLDDAGKQVFLRGTGLLAHMVGARDAIIKGFIEFPEQWVLTDAKTANTKNFNKIAEKGVAAVYPEYITQVILYMGYSEIPIQKGAIYVKNKDDDSIYLEFVDFDPEIFSKLNAEAEEVIGSNIPPMRLFSRSDRWSPCTFCKQQSVCYGEALPEVNCRTCIHADPVEGGRWHCARHRRLLEHAEMRTGCGDHLYIPEMLSACEALEGDDGAIKYMHKTSKIIFFNAIDFRPDLGTSSLDLQEIYPEIREEEL